MMRERIRTVLLLIVLILLVGYMRYEAIQSQSDLEAGIRPLSTQHNQRGR